MMDEEYMIDRTDARRLRTMSLAEAADRIMQAEGRLAFPVNDRIADTATDGGKRLFIEASLYKVDAVVHTATDKEGALRLIAKACAKPDGIIPELVTLVSAIIPGEKDESDDLIVIQCGRKPVFLVSPVCQVLIWEEGIEKRSPDEKLRRTRAKEAYMPLFRMLSAIAVREVEVCLGGGNHRDPSFKKDALHIRPNCAPPGESVTRNVGMLYGVPVANDLNQYVFIGPAAGRGPIAKDPDGTDAVQVVGNDIYLLFTIFQLYHFGSVKILRSALADAYRLWSEPQEPASVEKDELEAAVTGISRIEEEFTQKQLDLVATQIAETQKRLADLFAKRQIFLARAEAMRNGSDFKETKVRAVADIERIAADHRVERVEAVQGGLHVTTKKVVIEHEGVRYALGSYTIRVGKTRVVSIWTNGPTHPREMAHPHIDPHSGPCFGNAGIAILRAAGEGRVGDAVRHALSWLFEGYDAHVARTKIEEWPKADENGDPIPQSIRHPPPPGFLIKEAVPLPAGILVKEAAIELGVLSKDAIRILDETDEGAGVEP